MAAKKPSPITPTFAPSSREDLEARRSGVVALAPSGAFYRVRPINLERHALSGGLPYKLRQLATQGERGINRMLAAADEEVDEMGTTVRDYLDNIVLATIVEPKLEKADLGSGELTDDPLLHRDDYKWALRIALGEEDRDGEGRLLWGRELLNRYDLFRAEHACDPECEACQRVIERVSSPLMTAAAAT